MLKKSVAIIKEHDPSFRTLSQAKTIVGGAINDDSTDHLNPPSFGGAK